MRDRLGMWRRRLHGGTRLDCRIVLTVDVEHPSYPCRPDNLRNLLDALAAERVLATFFLQGQWAAAHPESARRIAVEGHLIGSHSHWHAPLTALTDQGIRASVQAAETAITVATRISPRPWFRCPYGSGIEDQRVLEALRELGYRSIPWDVAAGDWLPETDADELVETVMRGCLAHGDGARVLLHSWPDVTVAALPALLARLRSSGAQFVRLDAVSEPSRGHSREK